MKFRKLVLFGFLFIPFMNASASVIKCNTSASSIYLGDKVTVTFSGSLPSVNSTWSGTISSSGNVTYAGGDGLTIWKDGSSFSQSVIFSANSVGTASFTVNNIDVSDENQEYFGSDTCTVEIKAPEAPSQSSSSHNYYTESYDDEDEKSSDNTLKSLSIEGIKISPQFNNDVLEYTAIVDGKKDKINIIAEANDSKAQIAGLGEKELKEGLNTFEVVVTSENGTCRGFKLNITRKEINPIGITINNKKYIVIKKDVEIKIPNGFEKNTIKIENQEVEAYYNKATKYTIIPLMDEKGKTNWFYVINKNKSNKLLANIELISNKTDYDYVQYNEIKSNSLNLIVLEADKEIIPYNYKKIKFNIDNQEVTGYYLEYNSDYRLVYALNVDTNEKTFYLYDTSEKTFQRFYNSQVEVYRSLISKIEIVLISLGIVVVLLLFIIISLISSKRKLKRNRLGVDKDNKKQIKKEKDALLDL